MDSLHPLDDRWVVARHRAAAGPGDRRRLRGQRAASASALTMRSSGVSELAGLLQPLQRTGNQALEQPVTASGYDRRREVDTHAPWRRAHPIVVADAARLVSVRRGSVVERELPPSLRARVGRRWKSRWVRRQSAVAWWARQPPPDPPPMSDPCTRTLLSTQGRTPRHRHCALKRRSLAAAAAASAPTATPGRSPHEDALRVGAEVVTLVP